ncbi:D-glycerate dehydrogenase [Phycicoccus endophyticus]|uniref:D-glycerate dehydrogenase n=1 Tax=Phycicoccus endophyticus TaxID=1690220 RepID=A0A7G9R0E3_9MICO|nr:D-glycerate dehydrogenase [Phycicoccus endophyticus]NHI20116.1 D-glycerate dehydrogenase [Phycicoccus endophyticus]QNN49068.1 D-glycerate dehydrogenase [Phycicoccus endophyticus]GGL38268.1 D-glycerate dehydrogenase [Phycicoccus endophyticus]
MSHVVVPSRLPGTAVERLRAVHDVTYRDEDVPLPAQELSELVAGAHALVVTLGQRVDAALLDAAGPGLRVVANVAVGYDNVDLDACRERGVTVTNTPGVLTDATADIAFALVLMVTRRLAEAEREVRSGEAPPWGTFHLLGTSVQGKTIGILGPGSIGLATAHRARAFGMRVLLSGRSEPDPAAVRRLEARVVPFEELLAEADVLSVHTPLTPATRHLLDAAALARMKPSAVLVNTARGPVVDEAALAAALEAGTLAGAGLDVFEDEPRVHPGLLERDDVVLLPHIGSATIETRTAMADLAADNVLAVLAGRAPLTPVP